eukprot:SAG22_NODE_616_length_8539_cov_5.330213_4_plen_223_part_00
MMIRDGWNVKLAYENTNKGSLQQDAKQLWAEKSDNFNPKDEQHADLMKILKVPGEQAEEFKAYFLDENKLQKHWNVSDFFLKDTAAVLEDYDTNGREFKARKIVSDKAKLKWLVDLKAAVGNPEPLDITVPKGLAAEQAKQFESAYRTEFQSKSKQLDFTDQYVLQKTVASVHSKLFGGACVQSKRAHKKGEKTTYRLDPDELAKHEKLFKFRQVKKEGKKD